MVFNYFVFENANIVFSVLVYYHTAKVQLFLFVSRKKEIFLLSNQPFAERLHFLLR